MKTKIIIEIDSDNLYYIPFKIKQNSKKIELSDLNYQEKDNIIESLHTVINRISRFYKNNIK